MMSVYILYVVLFINVVVHSRDITDLNTATPFPYANCSTQEQRDLDYAEMQIYADWNELGRVHARGINPVIQPQEETRERFSTMNQIWQEMCATTDAPELVTLSQKMHSKVSAGSCGICLQRRGYEGPITPIIPAIHMNFKDIQGESNWNMERLERAVAQDCTEEKVSHGRPLKMVQLFGRMQDSHCICHLHISCGSTVATIPNAWITMSGEFLAQHWKLQYPQVDPTLQGKCPSNCIMFGPFYDGLKGMNVYREALQCAPQDDACKHKYIEMW